MILAFHSSCYLVMVFIYFRLILFCSSSSNQFSVVYAINCGGGVHTDSNGILYHADPLEHEGISSDYGLGFEIRRISEMDQLLYQSERYSTSNFIYNIPITEDGTYVLVLKFSEVFFDEPNRKVFDVRLNGHTTIIKDLDIFAKVGKGVAHDEYIEFDLRSEQVYINSESFVFNGVLSVEFIKGWLDNPKINAIVLFKSPIEDIPKLEGQLTNLEESMSAPYLTSFKRRSGIRSIDPYTSDDSWLMPLIIILALFIPVLIFLCRL